MTLGDYFVAFKYVFSISFLGWALGLLRWPSRGYLFTGCLLLACLAWLGLDLPLGRPYAVIEEHEGLFELAQPMVAAARGTSAEGWMVHQPNPRPLWSLLLAVAAGFDPERLLSIYRWVPLASIIFLSLSVYWGLGSFREETGLPPGLSRALAVFFVLFLSSNRLSFLHQPGPFWPQLFWSEPRLAWAVGLLVVELRLLGGARRIHSFLLAGVVLGMVAWMEPRFAAFAAIGALVWMGLIWKLSIPVWKVLLSLVVGLLLFLPWSGGSETTSLASATGTWHFAFNSVLALTLDKGLVFYLALFALARMVRSRKPPELFFAALTGTGFLLWIVSSLSTSMASLAVPHLLDAFLSALLAMAAGLGAHGFIVWLARNIHRVPDGAFQLPRFLRKFALPKLATSLLVALCLPWCFPYWWHPIRMDPTYVASLKPISRQTLALADWIRNETSPDAVMVAGPSYSPWIAALSGRRVLLIENDRPLADISSRKHAQSWFVESQDRDKILRAAAEWELTHLVWGRLDADVPVKVDHRFFESSPLFEKEWQLRRWASVFALKPQSP